MGSTSSALTMHHRRPRTLSTWPLVVRNDSMLVRCQRSLVAEAHTLFSPDTPHSQVVNAALTCLLRQPRARAAEFAFLWEVDHAPVTDDLLPHDRRIERAGAPQLPAERPTPDDLLSATRVPVMWLRAATTKPRPRPHRASSHYRGCAGGW